MKQVLIAWDLKNVKSGDNEKAKTALLRWLMSVDKIPGIGLFGSVFYQTDVNLPNTTIWALVEDNLTEEDVAILIEKGLKSRNIEIARLIVVEAGKGCVINR